MLSCGISDRHQYAISKLLGSIFIFYNIGDLNSTPRRLQLGEKVGQVRGLEGYRLILKWDAAAL